MNSESNGTIADLTAQTIGRLSEAKVSVVDFWASWCVPCKRLAPIYEQASLEIGSKHPGKVAFYKVDVEKEPALASTYGVMSIPAVIGFSGGKPIERFTGRSKEDLIRWVEKLLRSK